MTILHSTDFFKAGISTVAIEPRLPQSAFPEHHHDFHEIVIVEQGSGIHVFNGQPYTIGGGSVCFIRDHDRHLYEHTDNLCLTNVLYRAPDAFRFLAGVSQLLPQEQEGNYPSHWRVNQTVLQQVRHIVAQIEAVGSDTDTHAVASREILFMQLLVLLRKSSLAEEATNNDARLNQLLAWLEDHFAQEICWEEVAAQFSLSLRTLHRQLKQQTGLTPQRYLNRVRLMKARHLLRHSDESVTDIAYRCGFGDSNHFSTLFRREFDWSPRDIRQGTLSDYVDYRTYLDYDIKVTNTVSGQQASLSRVSRDSSGGENQAPFYVAICASLLQIYQKSENSIRLVLLDEAFSKMTSDRIRPMMELFRRMQLQVLLISTVEKSTAIQPYCDITYSIVRHGDVNAIAPFYRLNASEEIGS